MPEKAVDPTPPKAAPIEVPAESRVAKPAETPKPPEKSAEPPKAVELPKPDVPKPDDVKPDMPKSDIPKPDAPKPDTPNTPKPKDDPFGMAGKDTLRTWTDSTGRYQIEARFVSFEDGTVRMQKANGRFVRIAYELLGSADQAFVLKQDRSQFAMEPSR
jgi:hypothetical protein